MSKYKCVCELCDHCHRWLIGYWYCAITHGLEQLAFGPEVNAKGIALKRLLRQKETELEEMKRQHSTRG